jgi:hypothetical protein
MKDEMVTLASSYKKDRQFFIRQMYLDNGFFNTSQSQKGCSRAT